MYDVIFYSDGNMRTGMIMHSATPQNRARKLVSGSIVDEDNSISSFTFEIFANNPAYNLLTPRTSHIRVRDNLRGRYVFTGRVLDITPEMTSSGVILKSVTCEDRRGYLLDSVQPFKELQYYDDDPETGRTGLEVFIDTLLDNHNAQVEDFKKIYRGTVTVKTFESTNGVNKQLNWETTWDAIKSKLLDSFGGHIILREADGRLYLDYLESVGTISGTVIEVGKNMIDARKSVDPKDLVTRLVPLGTKLTKTDESGQTIETEERLTIESVNDGKIYIEAESYGNEYGTVYGTQIWDDVTDAANLLRKGTEWLAAHNALTISTEVSALNLSALGQGDGFELYALHSVVNDMIGLNDVMQIIKTTTDIINPQKSSFTLGDTSKTLSDALIQQQQSASDLETRLSEQVSKQVVNIVESYTVNYMSSLSRDVQGLKGSFEQQSITVNDLGTTQERLINFFTADASSMEFTFAEMMEAITGTAPSDTNYLKQLLLNFRFSARGLEIGKQSDPVTLRLVNDRISFLNNGVEVAYIADNKLYITDAQFLQSIIIGNYQFILEKNGSLSLVLAKNRK